MQTNNANAGNTIAHCIAKASSKFKSSPVLFRRLTVALLVVAILAGSVFSVAALSKTVRITDGDSTVSVVTFSSDTDSILETAGIVCTKDDVVVSSGSGSYIDITVYRASNAEIIVDGVSNEYCFSKGTVREALEKANVPFDANDIITPNLDTELTTATNISVTHMSSVTINADGKSRKLNAPCSSVSAALQYAELRFDSDDIVTPDVDSRITDGAVITLQRVEYKDSVKTRKIDYDIITKDSSSMYIGEEKVETKGQTGEETYTVRDTYIDGEYKTSEVLSSEITKKAVDKVVLCGTKEKKFSSGTVVAANGTLTDASGNSLSYSKLITGTCTAYSYSTGDTTSTGQYAREGLVAVNPNIIPYGTKLYIASPDGSVVYGYAIAADTGGALMDGRVLVDLFYSTDYECYQFGRRQMNVYVLG